MLDVSNASRTFLSGPPGPGGKDAYQSWLEGGNSGTEADFVASLKGQDGRDGLDGLGTLASRIAAVFIPPRTFIVDIGNGRCAPADPRVAAHRGTLIGFTANGAVQGSVVQAGTVGPFDGFDAGAFTPGAVLWISDGLNGTHLGAATETEPTREAGHAWTQVVGRATGATSINFERGPALRLQVGEVPYSPTSGLVMAGRGRENYLRGDEYEAFLTLDTPVSLPADIRAALGSPKVIEREGALDILAYPKAKLLLAQGKDADWRPLVEAACKLDRPLYFGLYDYLFRTRTPGSPNIVDIVAPVSVDVRCHPGARFLVHERCLRKDPEAYDRNPALPRDNVGILFAFDTGSDIDGRAPGSTRHIWKWVGGHIDWTPNLRLSTQGVGLMSGWDISRYDGWKIEWAFSEGGRTVPVLASIGAGFCDTGFSNHGCGPGKVDLCWFEGSRDEGVYLSGVVNPRIPITVNGVRFDTSLGTGVTITLPAGSSASPDQVFSIEDIVIGAVAGVGTEADAAYVRAQAGTLLRGLYTAIQGSAGTTLVIRAETAPWSYPTYEAQAGTVYYADRSIRLFAGTYYRCLTTHTTASTAFDATKWGPLVNATDNPVQRNAATLFVAKDERDAVAASIADPRGLGQKILNTFFTRCQNGCTMKRNGQFLEVAGNQFEECGGNILAGSVGYTPSSGTDYLSHGKRFLAHHNIHRRTQGYPISLTNSIGARIHDETIIDFGRRISDQAFTVASRAIAAVLLIACADCSVSKLYVANESPEWSAGQPSDFGKAPIGVYLATSSILKKGCTGCVIDTIQMRNVSWPLVSEAGGRDNLITNVPLRGLHRNAVWQAVGDKFRFPEDLRMSFTPGERRHILEMPDADPSRTVRLFQGIPAGERAGSWSYAAWYGDSTVAREDGSSFVIVARSRDRWLTKEIIGYIDATDPYLASKDPRVFLDPRGRLWVFIAQADYSPDRANAYGVWAAICDNPADTNPIIGTPFQLSAWGVPTRPLLLQDGRVVIGIDARDRPYVNFDQAEIGGSTLFELDLINRRLLKIARLPQIANVATTHDFPEGCLAQAPNGEIIYVIRTLLGQQISRSTGNGAQGTWSAFAVWTALGDNCNSRAAVRYLPSGNLAVVYNNFPGVGSDARQKMTVRISTDRGASFGPAYVLVNGIGASYPDLFILSPTEFAVVTDRNRVTDREIRQWNLTEAIVAAGAPGATDASVLSFISRSADWGG